jgi:mycofactocin system glycosyltransferase
MASVTRPAFRIDSSWHRVDPTTLLGGSPLTMFRVTPAGALVLDALAAGTPLPAGHVALTRRLVAAGVLHPRPSTPDDSAAASVTVVMPAYEEDGSRIAATLDALGTVADVIVVDDGSSVPLVVPGRSVVRLPRNAGPGAARNAGVERVTTPFVLFLDADAGLAAAGLLELVGHLDDPRVGAVAPRVRPTAGGERASAVHRYEVVRSPLDMGTEPAVVQPGTKVSYVPSAVLLCRTAALREIGGFDPSLRYGEDVDLIWRLDRAGWVCRYEPDVDAAHVPRATLRAWLRQRIAYGSAAAALDRRHPGALSPVRVSRWNAVGWTAASIGYPAAGLVAGIVGAVPAYRKLRRPGVPALEVAGRSGVLGALHAGRQLADATTSVWWPFALCGALVSKRARRALAVAVVVPAGVEWIRRRPHLDPLRFAALRTVDRAAYGAGVWRGVLGERRLGPLRPRLD